MTVFVVNVVMADAEVSSESSQPVLGSTTSPSPLHQEQHKMYCSERTEKAAMKQQHPTDPASQPPIWSHFSGLSASLLRFLPSLSVRHIAQ